MLHLFSGDRENPTETTPGEYTIRFRPIHDVQTATLTHAIMPQSMNNVPRDGNKVKISFKNPFSGDTEDEETTLVGGLYSESELRRHMQLWLDTINAVDYGGGNSTDFQLTFQIVADDDPELITPTQKEYLTNATAANESKFWLRPSYFKNVAADKQDGGKASPIWTILGFSTDQIYAKLADGVDGGLIGDAQHSLEAPGKYNGGHRLTALYICCEQLCNERQIRYSSPRLEELFVMGVMPMDPTANIGLFEPTAAQQLTFDLRSINGLGRTIDHVDIRLLGRLSNEEMYVVNFSDIDHHLTFHMGVGM
jgi:hypothetical protein